MTIKQIWIAECDMCGKTERAHPKPGRYNETDYEPPLGWGHGANKDFIICPECRAASGKELKEV